MLHREGQEEGERQHQAGAASHGVDREGAEDRPCHRWGVAGA